MHAGRYRLGEEVPLRVLCHSPGGAPAAPDACPRVAVYSAAGRPVADFALPALDAAVAAGLFGGTLFLDERFSAGPYAVLFRWTVSGAAGGQAGRFEVLPGGAGSGQVVALYSYERPHADFLVQQRTSGRIYKGKNPRA